MPECLVTQMTLVHVHLLLYKQLVSTLSLISLILVHCKNYATSLQIFYEYNDVSGVGASLV